MTAEFYVKLCVFVFFISQDARAAGVSTWHHARSGPPAAVVNQSLLEVPHSAAVAARGGLPRVAAYDDAAPAPNVSQYIRRNSVATTGVTPNSSSPAATAVNPAAGDKVLARSHFQVLCLAVNVVNEVSE